MSALTVSRHTATEEYAMPMNSDPGDDAHRTDQLGALRSDIRHLQADVAEIKAAARNTHQRLDKLRDDAADALSSSH